MSRCAVANLSEHHINMAENLMPNDASAALTASPKRAAVTVQAEEILRPKPSELRPITGSDSARFSDHLLSAVAGALWFPEGAPPEARSAAVTAALAAVRGFVPRDEAEGMMAAQAVALHHAAMECFRRAMLPEQPGEAADRLRRQGANLSRAMADMAEAIERRRGKGPQVVRVERVVVQDGGQAIVGAVAPTLAAGTPGGGSDAR